MFIGLYESKNKASKSELACRSLENVEENKELSLLDKKKKKEKSQLKMK